MCGKVLQKVHKLHKTMDPIFGRYLDKIPQSFGLQTVDEIGAGMGGDPTIDGVAVSQEKYEREMAAKIGSTAVTPDAAPSMASEDVQAAREAERKRKALLAGQGSTILTGSGGVTGQASTGKKTLLGA